MAYEAAYTVICPALTVHDSPSGLLAGKIRALIYAGVKIKLPSRPGAVSGQTRGRARRPAFYQQVISEQQGSCQLGMNKLSAGGERSGGGVFGFQLMPRRVLPSTGRVHRYRSP
jgi:hypothetical protein